MFHYATFAGLVPSQRPRGAMNMTRATINMISVSPFSATPACASMKLDGAYEHTGTQADTTA